MISSSESIIVQHQALENHVAVKVLRQFSDRVSDALLNEPSKIETWTLIDESETKIPSPDNNENSEPLRTRPSTLTCSNDGRLEVINEFAVNNRRNDTKFNILIIRDAIKEVNKLSPLARQQIAWSYNLDCKFFSNVNNYSEILSQMTYAILHSYLLSKVRSQKDLGPIKVDTSPKSIAPSICKHLQFHANKQAQEERYDQEKSIKDDDPFSGPLDFTLSTSQAKYILNVVEAVEGKKYYFGVNTKHKYYNETGSKLSNNAAKEVWMETTDSLTGNDLNVLRHDQLKAPVSRAYYKLSQVFDDYSDSAYFCISNTETGGCGMDVGSSPGGWTQVLQSETNAPRILSIDPALLAKRVENLDRVTHCKKDFTSDSAIEEIVNMAPFSQIVCDASSSAMEVFPKLLSTFDKVHEKLKHSEKFFLTVKSNIVVTIKMPANREQMMKKLLIDLENKMPSTVRCMMKWSNSEKAMFKVVHQMANSVTERTVIILLR